MLYLVCCICLYEWLRVFLERVQLTEEQKLMRQNKEQPYKHEMKRRTNTNKDPYASHGFNGEGMKIYDELLERVKAR